MNDFTLLIPDIKKFNDLYITDDPDACHMNGNWGQSAIYVVRNAGNASFAPWNPTLPVTREFFIPRDTPIRDNELLGLVMRCSKNWDQQT